MFDTILVPTDGSPLSAKAINAAVRFANEHGSEIVAFSVTEPYMYSALADGFIADTTDTEEFDEDMEKLARAHVEEIASLAKANNVRCRTTTVRSYDPAHEIIAATKRYSCDVIFMATHGRSWLGNLLMGSETQKVLTHSSIPVVVFR
jgi:nucleotide-binding universal stress UspA family protein